METSITVNKKKVRDLLSEGVEHLFLIPEYQRPYAWSIDQIDTLFDDLWTFAETQGGHERPAATYFLGSIVGFYNENKEHEIIDGQQRITTLFLLLRAIYSRLTNENTKPAKHCMEQIESAIWRSDSITGDIDYTQTFLRSRVVNDEEGNDVLAKILQEGVVNDDATDNYSRNYKRFLELLKQKSESAPLSMYDFYYAILNQAILLPVIADTQDTALTIFTTLNDRGMPLSDADIFKATIYNKCDDDGKQKFIAQWKELTERANEVGESVQQLFTYYMFHLRAQDGDTRSTTPGVRRYYSEEKGKRLHKADLMGNLEKILELRSVYQRREREGEEEWMKDSAIKQSLDILNSYPNEFCKYPVISYYLSHRDKPDFAGHFRAFLKMLISVLLLKYIETPTINAVKSAILKLDAEIIHSMHPAFGFTLADENEIRGKVRVPHGNIVRMILKILAYRRQEKLLPVQWEVEHILPQHWQDSYFTGIPEGIIREYLEHIGNKLPIGKRQNIQASDHYFEKKKLVYMQSEIEMTKQMADSPHQDWKLEDIAEADVRRTDELLAVLNNWQTEYQNA